MRTKHVYVISTPRTIIGIYESKIDALNQYGELLGYVEEIRLTCEVVFPDLPF